MLVTNTIKSETVKFSFKETEINRKKQKETASKFNTNFSKIIRIRHIYNNIVIKISYVVCIVQNYTYIKKK